MTKSRPVQMLSAVVLALAFCAAHAVAQSDAQKAFTTLKSLPGTWVGDTPKGPVEVDFTVTGAGSAVMSEIKTAMHDHEDMVSMFHMDGNRLLLTHYCSIGNQPRMQAETSPDGKTITFNFVDATNLSAPEAGHMQQMVLNLLDENHHTEKWVFVDHGKEQVALFDLRRKS